MDSITQITLGAAVGEAVLGRKIGNRAMIWGGIAGTIPDLDVLLGPFMTEMEALAFHRGPSHSLVFAICFPWLIALLTRWIYGKRIYQRPWYKWTIYISSLLVIGLFFWGIWAFVGEINGQGNWLLAGLMAIFLLFIYWALSRKYLLADLQEINVSYRHWVWFFFLTIVTHPILDSFTSYGTQLLWPFSDTRIAWDNISVADPFYTVPFLICLIIAACYSRHNPWRSRWNWIGIIISSAYMIWTFSNQAKATKVFEKYLEKNEIAYDDIKVSPSILNNFLWFGVAKSGETYHRGWWSTLDARDETDRMWTVTGNHALLDGHRDEKEVGIMTWFSDGWYQVVPGQADTLEYYDLRYGFSSDTVEYTPQSIFGFKLIDRGDHLEVVSETDRPSGDFGSTFKAFYERASGIE